MFTICTARIGASNQGRTAAVHRSGRNALPYFVSRSWSRPPPADSSLDVLSTVQGLLFPLITPVALIDALRRDVPHWQIFIRICNPRAAISRTCVDAQLEAVHDANHEGGSMITDTSPPVHMAKFRPHIYPLSESKF